MAIELIHWRGGQDIIMEDSQREVLPKNVSLFSKYLNW